MKQIFTILTTVIITLTAITPQLLMAQSPDKMTYQAVVRDADDLLVADQAVGMQISILQGSPTGTVVYTETQTPTTNINGLLSTEIGGGTDFNAINWKDGPYYLKTEFDPAGGTDYTITGTSQLLSIPYALHAKTADSVTGVIEEFDPIFIESVAWGITEADTTYWNNKLDTEVDGDITNELQLIDVIGNTIYLTDGGSADLPPEIDPVFDSSVAGGITTVDTANWNAGGGAETDPIFGASVAGGITAVDTAHWNDHTDSTDVANMGFPAGPHTDSTDVANMGYIAFSSLSQNSLGQITISDTGGTTPDPAAILDLQSTTRGFLLPLMTIGEMFAIQNAPDGLMVRESFTGRIFIKTPISGSAWKTLVTDDMLYIGNLNDGQTNSLENSHYLGNNSGAGHDDAANHTTAFGFYSGIGFGSGDNNTAIGANTGPASNTQDLHHTTTLGYNSKAEASHQVVLGTVNDSVIIPNTVRIKSQISSPVGTVGKLYVESADSNLYYHNGKDWNKVMDYYAVGDIAFGGVIYYVDETGKHGLVCHPADAESSMRWATQSNNNVTYAKADGIYAGQMNTAIAIASLGVLGDPSAAASCANSTSETPFNTNYGDFYLPSSEELKLMYDNKDAINTALTNAGFGFLIGNDTYWSSTEHDQVVNEAYAIDFSSGVIFQVVKHTEYNVRAIRRF